MNPKQKAESLWDSCIHSHIGAFTLTQEKKAIELIEKRLIEFEKETTQQTAEEILNILDEYDKDIDVVDNIQYTLGYDQALKDLKQEIKSKYWNM